MVRLASPPGTTRPSSSLSSKSIVLCRQLGVSDRHAAAEVSGAAHRSNGRPQSRAGADPGNTRPLKSKRTTAETGVSDETVIEPVSKPLPFV